VTRLERENLLVSRELHLAQFLKADGDSAVNVRAARYCRVATTPCSKRALRQPRDQNGGGDIQRLLRLDDTLRQYQPLLCSPEAADESSVGGFRTSLDFIIPEDELE
jgi:hypothetical protein